MERQPVSERVMRNRGTEGAVPLVPKASVSRSKPWPLPWPDLPAMLQPLVSVWVEWRRNTEAEQWASLFRTMKGPKLDEAWNRQTNTPTEHWGELAEQLLVAETSDPVALDRMTKGYIRIQPEQLPKVQAKMRENLMQWPRVDGLDPESVWALVCQPVQALNLVLVQGSPEAIGQALAQHLVVGTTPEGQDAALRLPGTAVRLTPEQATAASWAANRSGLFLRLVEPTE